MSKIDYTKASSTKTMTGHTLWNLIGTGLPLIAGLIAFPIMKSESLGLGDKKLEIFGIVWMLVGFSRIFDMGLGRALTRAFAEKLTKDRKDELRGLFWTTVIMISGLGVLAGVIIQAVMPLITSDIDEGLKAQVNQAFLYISFSMPFIILSAGMCGVLQAYRKFKLLNLIRVPAGMYTFIGPLCVFPFTRDLSVVVLVLILGRLAAMICYAVACLHVAPDLKSVPVFYRREVRELLRFGSWMTVSNIAVNFVNHINRFIIRTISALGEGVYYLIPEEIVVRVLMIPRAWVDVLFPAFVTSFHNDEDDPTDLFEKGVLYLILIMTPIIMGLAIITPEFLSVWLMADGDAFALKSCFLMRCLTIGVFIHSVARVIWYFLQAAGRPDLAAKLHMVELVLCIVGTYWMIRWKGVNGAAIAWTARATFDFIMLTALSVRFLNRAAVVVGKMAFALLLGIAMVLISIQPGPLLHRIVAGLICLVAYYVVCWMFVLARKEKVELVAFIRLHLSAKS
jgi:O-antigen/teichoic acid export membrane protein